ncbi:MAG: 16S rRNA (guanine(966)-N(2))-methyltransferase RsmD [Candidatus Cloacimonetes bacterium]|nr:16S rRNA (guanine(966)-N(2))-methyltransferase RsmD [Candidatus Cloacimonadota bacterium]
MRIITGKFKKANLIMVKGHNTRPTTDYIKEVIFSVIGDCADKFILDLYAGSGSLGLEAVSRGAAGAVFVDAAEGAVRCIRQNIEKLKCSEFCQIRKTRASAFLYSTTEKFDLIFLDPPYQKNLVNPAISLILDGDILSPGGQLVIERSRFEKLDKTWLELIEYDKEFGDTAVTVINKC